MSLLSRTRRHRAAHMIDDRERIGRCCVAAPGDMAVRAHQNKRPLIEGGDRRIIDADRRQRHAAFGEGALDRLTAAARLRRAAAT